MGTSPQLQPVLGRLFQNHPEPVRRVIRLLAASGGRVIRARALAVAAGLSDRDELYQLLKRDGLPPLSSLAQMIRVLNWSLEAETRGVTLARLAAEDGQYAAEYYRQVRKALDVTWSDVVRSGPEWVAEELRKRMALGTRDCAG